MTWAMGLAIVVAGSYAAAPSTGERWSAFARRTADWHALALVLVGALAVQMADTHGITTDGVIYFSQLRSLVFDGDLDVAAEFAALGQPPRPSHVVPIGPIVVWWPLYLVVAGVDLLGVALGWWAFPVQEIDRGLTLPYIRAALLSSFAMGAAGLAALHGRLRREFAPGVALTATLLLFGATPLVWYMVYEPSMTHAASFGFVAIFVVAAERWTAPNVPVRRAMVLGALVGLAFVTRPQEALFALFPAVLLLAARESWPVRLRAALRLAGWALIGALPWLVLQAVHAAVLFSRESFAVAGDGGYIDLFRSRWADTLWSSWHGFFSWTPMAYLAALGTVAYLRRHVAWAAAALLILFAMAWVNGATTDWAGGWSFGGRRFTSMLAVLAPGLAVVVHGLVQRPMAALTLVAMLAVAWNLGLAWQSSTGTISPDPRATFAQIVRQQAALATREPFVYPFAFPANAWFAWRTGLPIDRYDTLGAEAWPASMTVRMTRSADKYLLDGWAGHVSDPFGDLRWIETARAELVVPSSGQAVVVRVSARTRHVDPAVPVTLTVSLNGAVIGTLAPATDRPTEARFQVPGAAVRRGFNRLVFEKSAGTPPVAIYEVALEADSN